MIAVNNKILCESCFMEIKKEPCPFCGFNGDEAEEPDSYVLKRRSTLDGGRYIIGDVIGKGGFGITYMAYDSKLDRRIALKEYYPKGIVVRGKDHMTVSTSDNEEKKAFSDGADGFYKEAELLSRFNGNSNIVSVHDFFRENDTVYFTMGYLTGETLKTYINTKGRITEGQAVTVMDNIANALLITHTEDILHRDISPDNIMLCSDGTIKLIDFGAARQVVAEESQSLSVILKHSFAPLEQYQKRGRQGPWTDIYALGATIYNAVTGELPEDAMTRLTDDSVMEGKRSLFSEDLWTIVKKCMAPKIEDRYQSVFDLKQDLKKLKTRIGKESFFDIGIDKTGDDEKEDAVDPDATVYLNEEDNSDPDATVLINEEDQNKTVLISEESGDIGETELLKGGKGGRVTVYDPRYHIDDDKDREIPVQDDEAPRQKNRNEALFRRLLIAGAAVIAIAAGIAIFAGLKKSEPEPEPATEAEAESETEEPETEPVEPETEEASEEPVTLIPEGVLASGECGEAAVWYIEDNGVLTIAGEGLMQDYTFKDDKVETPWWGYRDIITGIVVSEGITSIGDNAFHALSKVTSADIDDGVRMIGLLAFCQCDSLEQLKLPAGLMEVSERAFFNSKNLKVFTIAQDNDNFRTDESVLFDKKMETLYCYPAGKEGESYTVPDTVKTLWGGCFGCNDNLTSLTLPEGLKVIGPLAFAYTNGIANLDIPASVEKIENQVFCGWSGKTLNFKGDAPDFNEYAFKEATENFFAFYLKEADWPHDKVRNYGGSVHWRETVNETIEKTGIKANWGTRGDGDFTNLFDNDYSTEWVVDHDECVHRKNSSGNTYYAFEADWDMPESVVPKSITFVSSDGQTENPLADADIVNVQAFGNTEDGWVTIMQLGKDELAKAAGKSKAEYKFRDVEKPYRVYYVYILKPYSDEDFRLAEIKIK